MQPVKKLNIPATSRTISKFRFFVLLRFRDPLRSHECLDVLHRRAVLEEIDRLKYKLFALLLVAYIAYAHVFAAPAGGFLKLFHVSIDT